MNSGIWYALGAYVLWGTLPVYWKLLEQVPALEVLGHRIGWSFVLLTLVIVASGRWKEFHANLNRRIFGAYTIASLLLSVNWLVYIWAVNAGYIVETSLGYFINPLLYVVLGMIFLGERLRPAQWIPVGLAAVGVIYLTYAYGSLPWIALTLAFSFGFYGLIKKRSPLGSLFGLTLETGLVLPAALVYLVYLEMHRQGFFGHAGARLDLLLIGAGAVTSIPLLLFASAAKRISLTMVGIMQYIAPSMQFLLGVFVYKEAFDTTKLIGFSIVWVALIIFWWEGVYSRRNTRKSF